MIIYTRDDPEPITEYGRSHVFRTPGGRYLAYRKSLSRSGWRFADGPRDRIYAWADLPPEAFPLTKMITRTLSDDPPRSRLVLDMNGRLWWRQEDGDWATQNLSPRPWADLAVVAPLRELIMPGSLGPWAPVDDGDLYTAPAGTTADDVAAWEPSGFVVKDSGRREEYANGFVRDTEEGKPDLTRLLADTAVHDAVLKEPRLLDFLATPGAALVPVELLIRWAEHMQKGAAKYGENNWRQARGAEPIARFARSFVRHSIAWLTGQRDEDHAVAIMFNVAAREVTAAKGEEDVTDE